MKEPSLLDRIFSYLGQSESGETADQIGLEFLRLKSSGPATAVLVRGILSKDGRFCESSPGTWVAQTIEEEAVWASRFLVAWVETGGQAELERWRLHIRPWFGGEFEAPGVSINASQPKDWIRARRSFPEHRLICLQPAALQRLTRWAERVWAIGEWDNLDLLSWSKLALLDEGVPEEDLSEAARLSAISMRWSLGPIPQGSDGPIGHLAEVLERIAERFPRHSERQFERDVQHQLAPRPVNWEAFQFSPGDIEALPDSSGIYRFFDASGALLYVGKAISLNRRVNSYFRPLPRESTKRETLLSRIHRFEHEELPSELEALIREAREIRERGPSWNVQLDVHPPESFPADWKWPLTFLPRGRDAIAATAILLRGPDLGTLLHIPRDGSNDLIEALGSWLDAPESAAPVPSWRLHPTEVWLALRYFARFRDQIDRCDLEDSSGARSQAEQLCRLAQSTDEGREPARIQR